MSFSISFYSPDLPFLLYLFFRFWFSEPLATASAAGRPMLNGRVLPRHVLLRRTSCHARVASVALGPVCCALAAHARAVLVAPIEVIAVIVLRPAGIVSGSMLHSPLTADHSVIAVVAAAGGCTRVWILLSSVTADHSVIAVVAAVGGCTRVWILHSTVTADHSVIAVVAAVGGCTRVWVLHSTITADHSVIAVVAAVGGCTRVWVLHSTIT